MSEQLQKLKSEGYNLLDHRTRKVLEQRLNKQISKRQYWQLIFQSK